MNAMTNTFRLTALSAALMAVFGPAMADDDEVAQLSKPDSSISVGIGHWSKDRHQQGIYDGMREGGAYGLLDAEIVKRDDATGTWMTLKARNLGLETREMRGEYLRQGDMGLSLEYSRIPRDNPNTFSTRLQEIGNTTQIVSTNAIPGPLRTIDLGTKRDITTLGLYKNLMPNLDFKLTFKNEEKTGERQWGRGSAAEFAVEPIDSTTRQIDSVLSYTTKKFQLSGGYQGSWYSTSNELVTVFTGTLGTSPTYLSQPLDNQAHKLFLNGGYSFTPTTRATLKMSYTRAMQDESLPTKQIAGLSLASSPSKLDGEINTTMVQLGLTSRPISDLSLMGSIRYHNVEDETPEARFVQPANGVCGTCVDNTPFSYKTLTAKAEGTYRLADGYNLTAGVEERRQDRHIPVSNALGVGGSDTQRVVPMRNEVDETTWRLELRRSLSEVLNGTLGYSQSRRTGSNYIFAAGPGNNSTSGFTNISNLINPINVADRDRKKVRLGLDWMPMESLSFQFNVEEGKDNYDLDADRPFGMDKGTNRLYSLDVAYVLDDSWQVNAWYSYDHSEAKQLAARASNAGGNAAIKDYKLEDTGNSVGLGLRGELTSRLKLGADLQWSRTVSKYQQTVTALNGTPGTSTTANFSMGVPDIENRLLRLGIFSTYSIDEKSDVRLDLIHERWKTDDWSWQFAGGSPFRYGTTTDGTMVTAKAKQTANFVGVRYIYNFQ